MICSLNGNVLNCKINYVIGEDTENPLKQPLQFRIEKSRNYGLFKVTSLVLGEGVICDSQSLYFSTVTQKHSGLMTKKHISTTVFFLFCHVERMLR